MNKPKKPYLEIARVCNTHGVLGDLKIEMWCDSEDTIRSLSTLYLSPEGDNPIAISRVRMHGRFLLLHADGWESPEAAASLKGQILYAKREDLPLPEGTHFLADLIGEPVCDAETGEQLGILSDVLDYPAGPIWEIRCEDGHTVLVPAVKEFLRCTDPDLGLSIAPIPGMFREASFGGNA